MPNSDYQFGLLNGPDLRICSADASQDKKLDLDNDGVLRLAGVSVAMLTDIDTLAELNAIIADGTLIDTSDARLSDARTPLGHGHAAGDLNSGEVSVIRGGTGSSTASGARTNLGLAIGSDIQAFDAGLLSIAGLATAADEMIYTTGSDAYAVAALSAYARTLLDDTDAAAARATLLLATMSQAEAEAGTATTTRAVTAQRIKQAIDALGGSAVDLIQSQTSVNVSSTDFTSGLSTAYSRLDLLVWDWEPVTDGAALEVVLSTNEGTSWAEAAGSYAWVHGEARGGNATRSGSDSATLMEIVDTAVSNVAGEGASGIIVFKGAKSTTARCSMEWLMGHFDTATRRFSTHGSGIRLSNEDITGIRARASVGNHSSKMELWGYRDT